MRINNRIGDVRLSLLKSIENNFKERPRTKKNLIEATKEFFNLKFKKHQAKVTFNPWYIESTIENYVKFIENYKIKNRFSVTNTHGVEKAKRLFIDILSPLKIKPHNQKLYNVFQNTLKSAKNKKLDAFNQSMIENTKLYVNSNKIYLKKQKEFNTNYSISNLDSFSAANKLGNNVAVLNLANAYSFGGGVTNGSKAQEEDLMRCSNYYLVSRRKDLFNLNLDNKSRCYGRVIYNKPLPEFGSLYTPNVIVFKDRSKNYEITKPFTVSCIASAGYDLGKSGKNIPSKLKSNGKIDFNKLKFYTEKKIKNILDVAILNGHTSIVLGAISCGAFVYKGSQDGPRKTREAIAEAYKNVLLSEKYKGKFKEVNFAILEGKNTNSPSSNYYIFNKMIQNINNEEKIKKSNSRLFI